MLFQSGLLIGVRSPTGPSRLRFPGRRVEELNRGTGPPASHSDVRRLFARGGRLGGSLRLHRFVRSVEYPCLPVATPPLNRGLSLHCQYPPVGVVRHLVTTLESADPPRLSQKRRPVPPASG